MGGEEGGYGLLNMCMKAKWARQWPKSTIWVVGVKKENRIGLNKQGWTKKGSN